MSATNVPYTALEATMALGYLGTNALPPLLAVAANARHPARLGAITAIGSIPDIGDAARLAVPVITNYLNVTNTPTMQIVAITALGNLRAAPQISVPALVSTLKSKNAKLRLYSAIALGNFGPQAIGAVSALTNALTDSDPLVHYNTEIALHKIDPATFANAPSQ
jgi:HEAT repeat protein